MSIHQQATTNIIVTEDDGQESATVYEGGRCDYGHCSSRADGVSIVGFGHGTVDIRPVCVDCGEALASNSRQVAKFIPFRSTTNA